jgi:hypothetical protein
VIVAVAVVVVAPTAAIVADDCDGDNGDHAHTVRSAHRRISQSS